MNNRAHASIIALLLTVLVVGSPAAGADASSDADAPAGSPTVDSESHPVWEWPLDGAREIAAPFRAPAHEYGAGHRGMDLTTSGGASVRAPAAGVVAFRGTVVDRPLITIEHADGYVSTFEPLLSTLSPGDLVRAGDDIGTVATGGHAAPGTLHLGVRLDGVYINPQLLFGAVPRAVLLPCCEAG